MTEPTENQKNEPNPRKKPDDAFDLNQSKKRFEDAVLDAQYMLIYASGKCPKDINKVPIEKLIDARQRLEKGEKLSVQEEKGFWVAYQELWKLIKPATAESVKANYKIEETIVSKLFGNIPILSRRLGKWTISKSRRTVNRYIVFTVFVLLLVLAFQIYWVIGNQLSVKLDELLEAERNLSVQISENAQGSSVLDVQFKQDATETQKTGLEKNLQSIESQLVQTSLIFLNWSSPWKGLITKGELEHGDTYDLLLAENDAKIADIDLQLSTDPTGINAAKSDEAGLAAQLVGVKGQATNEKIIQDKIALVRNQSTLEAALTSLNEKELDIQRQMDEMNTEKESLAAELTFWDENKKAIERDLIDQKSVLEKQRDDINMPVSDPAAPLPEHIEDIPQLETLQESIQAQIDYIDNLLSADPDFNKEIVSQNSLLPDQVDQLRYVLSNSAYLENRIADIEAQLREIDGEQNTRIASLKTELLTLLTGSEIDQGELQKKLNALTVPDDTLQAQSIGVWAAKDVLQAQIESLQFQIEGLQINTDPSRELEKKLKEVGAQIVFQLNQEKQRLMNEKEALGHQEEVASIREDSGPAQLAGHFVLDILQGYLLPLLYGILGAATYVLRSLSRQIKNVTYSEVSGLQHLSHISLGALAGILVGWFSVLIPNESFVGSVSPLAIAFLVGYNIELFFSKMDEIVVTRLREIRQRTLPNPEEENQAVASSKALNVQPAQEPHSGETPAAEGAAG